MGTLGAAAHGTWLPRTHCPCGQLRAIAVELWFCGRKETPGASGGARGQKDHCRRLAVACSPERSVCRKSLLTRVQKWLLPRGLPLFTTRGQWLAKNVFLL